MYNPKLSFKTCLTASKQLLESSHIFFKDIIINYFNIINIFLIYILNHKIKISKNV